MDTLNWSPALPIHTTPESRMADSSSAVTSASVWLNSSQTAVILSATPWFWSFSKL
ncbi:hypothetical protein APASM_1495 [Actinosynnema pretiosum subsp. pretiosum]|nr:hypothetical protein APASM_1495 [Actinosynnema pretiosum subsp. pretiosum]